MLQLFLFIIFSGELFTEPFPATDHDSNDFNSEMRKIATELQESMKDRVENQGAKDSQVVDFAGMKKPQVRMCKQLQEAMANGSDIDPRGGFFIFVLIC